jgi:hypothetical protein
MRMLRWMSEILDKIGLGMITLEKEWG